MTEQTGTPLTVCNMCNYCDRRNSTFNCLALPGNPELDTVINYAAMILVLTNQDCPFLGQ